MTKLWSLRLAAFAFGLGVALPATAYVDRKCWVDSRGIHMCAPVTREEWREHHRDWHPVPLHEERQRERWDYDRR
jgi:hypothetical protein